MVSIGTFILSAHSGWVTEVNPAIHPVYKMGIIIPVFYMGLS